MEPYILAKGTGEMLVVPRRHLRPEILVHGSSTNSSMLAISENNVEPWASGHRPRDHGHPVRSTKVMLHTVNRSDLWDSGSWRGRCA